LPTGWWRHEEARPVRAARCGAINVGIALTALRTNLMRSILTTVGVMIGVFAVTLAVAVGSGAQVSVMDSINALGSNMALVFPEPEAEGGRTSFERGRLTLRDARAIERSIPGVSAVAPQLRAGVQLVTAGRRASTTAIGATAGFGPVAGIGAESGPLHHRRGRALGRARGRARADGGGQIVRHVRSGRRGVSHRPGAVHRDRRARIQGARASATTMTT
jgi:hypothetical protein